MNDTTLLLGLPDVVVDRVDVDPDGARGARDDEGYAAGVSVVRSALDLGEGVGLDRAA